MRSRAASASPAELTRSVRDPAIAAWVIAGVCWLATAGTLIAGWDAHAQHGFVLGESGLSWPLRIGVFVAVWLVMIGAMMLPTTVPMLRLFWAATATRPHPARQRSVLIISYLVVWAGFALVALLGDAGIHAVVDAWHWLEHRSGLVLAGALLLAGAFQFSPLKKACLNACRSPMSLLWQHYRRDTSSAWALGFRHALLCLGCCWALMLVMFATGVGSLLWMLGLAVVMVLEKTVRWGSRLVVPVGLALIIAGAAIALVALTGGGGHGHEHGAVAALIITVPAG